MADLIPSNLDVQYIWLSKKGVKVNKNGSVPSLRVHKLEDSTKITLDFPFDEGVEELTNISYGVDYEIIENYRLDNATLTVDNDGVCRAATGLRVVNVDLSDAAALCYGQKLKIVDSLLTSEGETKAIAYDSQYDRLAKTSDLRTGIKIYNATAYYPRWVQTKQEEVYVAGKGTSKKEAALGEIELNILGFEVDNKDNRRYLKFIAEVEHIKSGDARRNIRQPDNLRTIALLNPALDTDNTLKPENAAARS